MPTFAVTYTYDSTAEKRDAHRAAHRSFLQFLHEDGQVLASGPLESDPAAALIVVKAADADAALKLLEADPFHREGLIGERTAVRWDPVIGPWAG